MKRVIAGAGTLLIGLWAFPYIRAAMDPIVTLITGLFPTMNSYLLLFLTWLPFIVIGIIIYAVISLVLNLGGKR